MAKKYLFIMLLLLITLSSFSGCRKNRSESAENSIQIKGSDTMVNLTQSWAEEFIKTHPRCQLAVTGGGSGTGIGAFISKTCDIVQSSRMMEEKEINEAQKNGINPVKFIMAMDGIEIVVNPSNPVSKLTMDELRDIFMGTVKNWKYYGGPDAEIIILSREVNSGTHVFFKEHVLRRGNNKSTEEFAREALLMPSSQGIADEISNNPEAIGYFGMGYDSPKQKVITVAKDKNSTYYKPTGENILSNKYPISRPLYFYTDNIPQGEIKGFMDFAFSGEGQKIVKDVGFVPLINKK